MVITTIILLIKKNRYYYNHYNGTLYNICIPKYSIIIIVDVDARPHLIFHCVQKEQKNEIKFSLA